MNRTTIIILTISIISIISLVIYVSWPKCAVCVTCPNPCDGCPTPVPIECSDCDPDQCVTKCKTCSNWAGGTGNIEYDLRIPDSNASEASSRFGDCGELITASWNTSIPGSHLTVEDREYTVTLEDLTTPSETLVYFLLYCGGQGQGGSGRIDDRPYDKIGISRQINGENGPEQDIVNLLTSPFAKPTEPPYPAPNGTGWLPRDGMVPVKQNLCVLKKTDAGGNSVNINWDDAAVRGLDSVNDVNDFYESYGTESSFAGSFFSLVPQMRNFVPEISVLELVKAFDLKEGDKLTCAKREMDCEGLHKFVGNFNNPQRPCTEIKGCKCSESD